MAKRIQISPNSGTNWYTFPGDKGELHDEASAIKDTVFGQDFASNQTGMINWNVTTNGIFKGFAGYVAKIMSSGTPVAMNAEAMSLISGKIYSPTATTKRVFDRSTPIVVKDGTTVLTPGTQYTIDYLFGQIILDAGYSPVGAITIFTGKYLPMTQVAKANGFTLTQTASATNNSVFETAQANGGYNTYEYGLRTVSLSLKGIYAASNGFRALLAARSELVIEINPDGSGKNVARGFFKAMNTGQSGNVGELEDQTLNFSLSVPDQDDVSMPFDWTFNTGSTLNRAIKEAIIAWQDGTVTNINYLENGTTGIQGEAIVTDLSLSGGLDAMNEFSIKFQGSDAPEAYP